MLAGAEISRGIVTKELREAPQSQATLIRDACRESIFIAPLLSESQLDTPCFFAAALLL